jgi:hypothetical protein
METIAAAIADPEGQKILVRAKATCTPAITAAYSSFPPSRLSWTRGFLDGPPLDLDLTLPQDRFIDTFQIQLRAAWGTQGARSSGRLTDRILQLETNFVAICLPALERWNRESDAILLWDIDETLLGSGSRLRFLRPSSEIVLRYAERHFTNLRHGMLSSLAPEWIPAAADLIAQVLGRSSSFGEANFRFSFRPALDRFDGVDWDSMVQALRRRDLPACGRGTFQDGWPFYVTEFSRVLALHAMRTRGHNVKVIDNDLNACFDMENTAENQVGNEARQWLNTMLGETCATGPHWWPQEAEEWILQHLAAARQSP